MNKAFITYEVRHKTSGKVFKIHYLNKTELSGSRDLSEKTEPIFKSSSQFKDEKYQDLDIEIKDGQEIIVGFTVYLGPDKLEYEVICID